MPFAEKLQQKLQATEWEADSLLLNDELWEHIAQEGLSTEELLTFQKKPYSLLLYYRSADTTDEQVIGWTSNDLVPPSLPKGDSGVVTTQGYRVRDMRYVLMTRSFTLEDGHYQAAVLIPVRKKFSIENRYLHEQFPLLPELDKWVTVAKDSTDAPVVSWNGETIVWLAPAVNEGVVHHTWPTQACQVLGFVLLFLALALAVRGLAKKRLHWLALFLLLGVLGLLRVGRLFLDYPNVFSGWPVFKTIPGSLYGLAPSPGDLLVNALLLLWVSVFFVRRMPFPKPSEANKRGHLFIGYAFLCCILYLLYQSFERVFDFAYAFDTRNIFSIDEKGAIGLAGLILLEISAFLVSFRVAHHTSRIEVPSGQRLGMLLAAIGLLLALGWWQEGASRAIILPIFAAGLVPGMEQFSKEKKSSPAWLATWIIYFAAFSSVLLYLNGKERDLEFRRDFAEALGTERDSRFESNYASLESNLLKDRFIQSYLQTAFNPKVHLEDRINDRYLDNLFFLQYEYDVHCYSPSNYPLAGENKSIWEFDEFFDAARATNSPNLYFLSDPNGTYRYLAKLTFLNKNGEPSGTVIIEFRPKMLLNTNVYIQLLAEGESQELQRYRELSFGVYKHSSLVREEGGGAFPQQPEPEWGLPPRDGYRTIISGDKELLYYHASTDNLVIVGKQKDTLLQPFSLFSFMFCLLLLTMLALLLVNRYAKLLPGIFSWDPQAGFSLRTRIQVAVVAVILVAFVTIAVVTIYYNRRQLAEYHRSRLERKVDGATSSAKELFAYNNYVLQNARETEDLVNALASSQRLVINLYDLDGKLLQSSKELVFERKFVSRQMHPAAYHAMVYNHANLFVQTENIGTYEYQTAYAPMQNSRGETIAYLGIPYDSKDDQSSRRDSDELLGALLNVYVLLLLVAGAVALAVANTITRSLSVIADKLRQVKLGRPNEPLEWVGDDEIGTLVNRYNDMIQLLDKSTAQLAKNQKELAWREMAKQVAHEIKNPLTPMKLNIQLLQRAAREDPQQAKDMIARVSANLIGQIDSLAQIATEFADFAKMPQAHNERVSLNDIVSSVYELFQHPEEMDFCLELPDQDIAVFADKNQLIRVFNNLIKNATQAIPDGRAGKVHVSLVKEDQKAIVKVTDNGVGIPEDKQLMVFVPNFTTKSSGTGIGLAMSKNIVEAADGKIYFETQEGVGTTFFVELNVLDELRIEN